MTPLNRPKEVVPLFLSPPLSLPPSSFLLLFLFPPLPFSAYCVSLPFEYMLILSTSPLEQSEEYVSPLEEDDQVLQAKYNKGRKSSLNGHDQERSLYH